MLVNSKKTRIMKIAGFFFFPGINTVKEEDVAAVTAHPMFDEQCDLDEFVVVDGGEESTDVVSVVLEQNSKTAAKTVADILDVDDLNALLAKEDRKSVIKVINKQLELLHIDDEKKEEE